jgi:hypothetical protein
VERQQRSEEQPKSPIENLKSSIENLSSHLGGSNASFSENPPFAFLCDLSGFAVNLELVDDASKRGAEAAERCEEFPEKI